MADAVRPRRVAITGASGLIGRHLAARLSAAGQHVLPAQRHGEQGLQWRPEQGIVGDWSGTDAVVHLAGATIGKRWTARRKRMIWDSRVPATRRLCEDLAALDEPPARLVCASAVGYYGDRDEPVGETAAPGHGFLAEVCQEWEAAADPARDAGIVVAHVRSGVVLARDGGAMVPLRRLARAGLSGPIGSGRQWFAWIHVDDEVAAIEQVLASGTRGPINLVSPGIVRQREFARALARSLRRPAIAPMPGFVMRTMFGQMGQQLFLWGQHVVPRRLEEMGFRFRFADLDGALADLAGGPAAADPGVAAHAAPGGSTRNQGR